MFPHGHGQDQDDPASFGPSSNGPIPAAVRGHPPLDREPRGTPPAANRRQELKTGLANADQATNAVWGISLMLGSIGCLLAGEFLYGIGGGALSAFLLYHNYPRHGRTNPAKELFVGLLRVVRAFAVVFAIVLCLCVPPMLIAGQFRFAAIAAMIAALMLYYLYPRLKNKRPPV